MKEFRRPFKKTSTAFDVKVCVIIFVLLIIPTIFIVKFNIFAILFLFIFLLIIIHLWIAQLFYVILTIDKLVIQNGIYQFWKKEALYKDIVKVKIIWHGGRAYPCMKIITKNTSKLSWFYTIDYVAPRDYPEIVEELETRGVLVETKDIDTYITMMENTNRKAK